MENFLDVIPIWVPVIAAALYIDEKTFRFFAKARKHIYFLYKCLLDRFRGWI